MITIDTLGGRFGNILFQLYVALMLSERFGIAVQEMEPKFHQIFYIHKERQTLEGEPIKVTNDNYLDILKGPRQTQPLIIVDYFQTPWLVKQMLTHPWTIHDRLFDKASFTDDLYVHVRLGDVHSNMPEGLPNINYYKNAIEEVPLYGKGWISSDSPDDPKVKELMQEYGLELFEGNDEETLEFASKCHNKVLSPGSFSWWIGFLGSQNNVIHPWWDSYKEWHPDIYMSHWKGVS